MLHNVDKTLSWQVPKREDEKQFVNEYIIEFMMFSYRQHAKGDLIRSYGKLFRQDLVKHIMPYWSAYLLLVAATVLKGHTAHLTPKMYHCGICHVQSGWEATDMNIKLISA